MRVDSALHDPPASRTEPWSRVGRSGSPSRAVRASIFSLCGLSPSRCSVRQRVSGRGAAGFSYIELLLALVIFPSGFASFASLTSLIGQHNQLAQQVMAATLIGQTQLEKLKLLGYAGLNDTSSVDGTLGPLNAQGASAASGKYTVTWDVQNNVPLTGAKRVLLTVSWRTDNNKLKNITLDTVVINAIL